MESVKVECVEYPEMTAAFTAVVKVVEANIHNVKYQSIVLERLIEAHYWAISALRKQAEEQAKKQDADR